jgi:hypothetical protein
MEMRYASRKQQLLVECQVASQIFDHVKPRLATFMAPFVCGLLTDSEHQNVESAAYRFGQDRLPLQRFIGWARWYDVPLRQGLRGQVAAHLGQAEGFKIALRWGCCRLGRRGSKRCEASGQSRTAQALPTRLPENHMVRALLGVMQVL